MHRLDLDYAEALEDRVHATLETMDHGNWDLFITVHGFLIWDHPAIDRPVYCGFSLEDLTPIVKLSDTAEEGMFDTTVVDISGDLDTDTDRMVEATLDLLDTAFKYIPENGGMTVEEFEREVVFYLARILDDEVMIGHSDDHAGFLLSRHSDDILGSVEFDRYGAIVHSDGRHEVCDRCPEALAFAICGALS